MRRTQDQTGGEGSTNLQAGRDIVYSGMTVTEVREIALDVYNANFLKLAGVAEDVARGRAERITHDYLEKLQTENPSGLDSVQDPDMLQAIYTAQKAYACSGEEDLEKTLIDLLVDRSGQRDRELKTLVLNEAISVLPKLSARQRRSVAVCFIVRYTRFTGPLQLESYYSYLGRSLTPFAELISGKRADCLHIQSAGAGSIATFPIALGKVFTDVSRGYFTKGFTADKIPDNIRRYLNDPDVFVPCIRDPQKLQVSASSFDDIWKLAAARNIDRSVLDTLSLMGIMSYQEIQSELESLIPGMDLIFERWDDDNAALNRLELTSVGITIGHAYWRQAIGDSAAPLDIWL